MLSAEQIAFHHERALSMYRCHMEGDSLSEVGKQFGVCHQTVRKIFGLRGWPIWRVRQPPVLLAWEPLSVRVPDEVKAAARVLWLDKRQVSYYVRQGVPVTHADRLAVSLGLTPWRIWGQEWVDAEDEMQHERLELREKFLAEHGEMA